MTHPTFLAIMLLALIGVSVPAHAEKADRNKTMNIEADAMRYDDVRQISVFTGRVVLSKGSIVIRGSQVEVRQDPEGYQHGVVTGSGDARAFFRQKRDGVDEFIEGEGDTIEYDGRADTVRFVQKAVLRRLRGAAVADEITGGVIIYENLTDRFSVDGGATQGTTGTAGTLGGRVRAMLSPKTESPASAPVSGPPASLRPSTSLDGNPR